MTGFGNFSYYYIRKDFTLLRFAQMMWRLNFFVFFVCATMNNECVPAGRPPRTPLHTLDTHTLQVPSTHHPHLPRLTPPSSLSHHARYMLYYICAMHTFFTWMVYLALYVGNQFNENDVFCAAKILVTLAITAVLYDVDGVFHMVFKCARAAAPRLRRAPHTRRHPTCLLYTSPSPRD